MAVYRSFPNSSYAQAAETAALYLRELGIFESVTLSGSTVTCSYGGETVAEFAYSSGSLALTFGVFSKTIGDMSTLWLGRTANGVLLDHLNPFVQSGNMLYSIAVFRSQSGVPMLVYRELNNGTGTVYALACDALAPPSGETVSGLSAQACYSNLIGVCTVNTGSEAVASGDRVFRYAERQTNVPVNCLCVVSIGGTDYLTDGFIAVLDAENAGEIV